LPGQAYGKAVGTSEIELVVIVVPAGESAFVIVALPVEEKEVSFVVVMAVGISELIEAEVVDTESVEAEPVSLRLLWLWKYPGSSSRPDSSTLSSSLL
jgi:hypothetical protein